MQLGQVGGADARAEVALGRRRPSGGVDGGSALSRIRAGAGARVKLGLMASSVTVAGALVRLALLGGALALAAKLAGALRRLGGSRCSSSSSTGAASARGPKRSARGWTRGGGASAYSSTLMSSGSSDWQTTAAAISLPLALSLVVVIKVVFVRTIRHLNHRATCSIVSS